VVVPNTNVLYGKCSEAAVVDCVERRNIEQLPNWSRKATTIGLWWSHWWRL